MPNFQKTFSKIYDHYVDKIYRFIFLKVNVQEIAEDLTSETFLRTWEKFKQGAQIENFQAFLYQTARNLVVDYYRQKDKAQIVSTEFSPIADSQQTPEEKSVLESDMQRIKLALGELKEDYQNIIIWHYLNDFSVPEVAKLLGKSEEATRVLLHRALQALKRKLT